MNTPHLKRIAAAALFLTLLAGGLVAAAWARPPGTTPTAKPPVTMGRPSGGFHWQGLVEGAIRGQLTPGARPGFGVTPGFPSRTPPPTGIRITPPDGGRMIEPGRLVAPQPNVVPGAAVTSAILKIPRQLPPLAGRFWEVSVREARCYAAGLQRQVEQALGDAEAKLVAEGGNVKALGPLVDQVRQMVGRGAAWREIEPVLKSLFETHLGKFSPGVRQSFQHVLELLLVRNGFMLVGGGAPRGRGAALEASGIPVGLVWVLFDPTLPVGTGLVVNDFLIVCGAGGQGDLSLVRTSAADALGLPVAAGPPVPDLAPDAARTPADGIVLRCDENAPSPVNYVLNSTHTYTAKPGFKQTLSSGRTWVVEFDRGGGRGAARYTLSKGAYEFRVVGDHWELLKLRFEIVIDNREGSQEFQYVAQNQVVSVPPGETKLHQSEIPIRVEFDRGLGPDEPAVKDLNKSGTYKVAVNSDSNTWDLFSAAQMDLPPAGEGQGSE